MEGIARHRRHLLPKTVCSLSEGRSDVMHWRGLSPCLIDANSIGMAVAGNARWMRTWRDGTRSGPSLGSPSIQFRPAEMLSRSCSEPAAAYRADLRACSNALQGLSFVTAALKGRIWSALSKQADHGRHENSRLT